jgi:hypothetical protein
MSNNDFLLLMLIVLAGSVLLALAALIRNEARERAATRARINQIFHKSNAAWEASIRAAFQYQLETLVNPVQTGWADVLGIKLPTTLEQVNQAYRTLCRRHHPDAGGTDEQMQQLNEARTQALRWLKAANGR